jgi:inositol transport system substrate-binding protein
MKRMKKFLSIVLVGCLAMGLLVGCGSSSSGGSSGSAKILYVLTDTDDTFRATLSDGIMAAAESAGVQVDMVETGNDVSKQLELVEGAKASGYNAIIMLLADSDTALQMQVASNDLPIAYVNARPDDSVLKENKYVFVGSDEEQAGEFQAEYVWNKLGKPSSMNIVILEGQEGHSGTIGRTSAVKYFFKDQGVDANYVFVDFCNWTAEGAEEKLDVFFQTGQSFDAVFCNNDTMALGACEALKNHGYDLTKIPVCGVDATADGCASVKAGEMQFTVLQDAAGQAAGAVQACITMANGGDITDVEGGSEDKMFVWIPFQGVDASNVSDFM